MTQTSKPYAVGDVIRIVSLVMDPHHLNGCIGVITGFNAPYWNVRLYATPEQPVPWRVPEEYMEHVETDHDPE